MQSNMNLSFKSFSSLVKLNISIYLHSVSTYVVLAICLVLYALYTFLTCHFGIAVRMSGYPFDSQLFFILSGVVAGNIISQYRDGFYRNKIICGNKKSTCYLADYLVSLLYCWIIAILTSIIFLIMYYSVDLQANSTIEKTMGKSTLYNIYNNYLLLNLLSFLVSTAAAVAFITFISQMLCQRPKFAQTIAILFSVFASLVPFIVMIITATNANYATHEPSKYYWIIWLCWADPFSSSIFTNDAILQMFTKAASEDIGVDAFLVKGFNYISAAWYQLIMNLGWTIIINTLGISLYSAKDFK